MNYFVVNDKKCYIEFFKLIERSKLIKRSGFSINLTAGKKALERPRIYDLKDENKLLDLQSSDEVILAYASDGRYISIIPRYNSVRIFFNQDDFDYFICYDVMKFNNSITFCHNEAILKIDNTWLCKNRLEEIYDLKDAIGLSNITFLPDREDGMGVQGVTIKCFRNNAEVISNVAIDPSFLKNDFSSLLGNYDSKTLTSIVKDVSLLFIKENKYLKEGLSVVLPTIKDNFDAMFKYAKNDSCGNTSHGQKKKTR